VKDNFLKNKKQIKRRRKKNKAHGHGQPGHAVFFSCLIICPLIFIKAMRRLPFHISAATSIFIKSNLRVDPTMELGSRSHGST